MPVSKIASATDIAGKWKRVTPGRSADYEKGVTDSSVNWAGPTAASESTYSQATQDAIARGSFGKGVRAAGDEHWRSKTSELGVPRWGQGVNSAEGDMADGIAPYVDVIAKTDLPPRRGRGDPQNMNRSSILAAALSKRRTGA